MKLTPRQRRLAFFALIVLLNLAGLLQHALDPAATAPTTSIQLPALERTVALPDTHMAEPGDRQPASARGLAHAASIDSYRGCSTRPNAHNFSPRNGTPVRVIAPHYTVSRNTPGWGDVNGVAAFLNLASTQASAHFIIDAEGNCLYTVPTDLKAWTEAGGNSFTVGIEFVAMGDEGALAPAQIAKGGLVIAQVAKRYGIPLQIADVTGCTPRRPGLADHMMFGLCGGGHHDLRPLFGTSASARRPGDDARALEPLLRAARSHSITAVDRVTCRKLNWWRAHGRPHGKAAANAVRRRKALESRGVRCLPSGPVKVTAA